jgi:ABC-2 type transport system permease protein
MTKPIKNFFSRNNKILLTEMVRTDFKLRYQNSVLGYIWSLLKPLMLFVILYVIFTKFLNIGRGIPNYAVSLLLGIVLWNFFAEATTSALKSIVGRGALIRKINIPRYLIPISVIASSFINLALNLIVVCIFILFADNPPISLASLVFVPLLLLELVVISVAVGFFLSAVFVRYRDIEHIWDVVKQALFYAIPIIYPLSKIEDEVIQKVLIINPLAQIIQDMRALLSYGATPQIHDIYGSYWPYTIPLGLIVVALGISSAYFRKRSKYFAEDI